jgi:hypothetical protein
VDLSGTSTKVTVMFADTTKHFSKILSGAGAVGAKVFEGMSAVNSGGTLFPIPAFSKVTFASAKIDGKTPAAVHAVATDMKTTGGTLQIATSPLSATGNSWTETFKHS